MVGADDTMGLKVIDKDLLAALLASQIHADALLTSLMRTQSISTGVSQPNARWVQVMPELLNEMQFDAGSMGRKSPPAQSLFSQCRAQDRLSRDGPEILAETKAQFIRLDLQPRLIHFIHILATSLKTVIFCLITPQQIQ